MKKNNVGDLLLVKHNSFMGHAIREVIKCDYNHVAIFVTSTQVVEATFRGVKLTDIKSYEQRAQKGKLSYDIYTSKTPFHLGEQLFIVNYCVDKVGEPYDYLQFLSLLVFFLFSIDREHIDPIDCRSAFICSELIAQVYKILGRVFNDKIDIDNITPLEICSSKIVYKKK